MMNTDVIITKDRRFKSRFSLTDPSKFPINPSLSGPHIVSFVPIDALESRGITNTFSRVLHILRWGGWPKVLASVIESVMVRVIALTRIAKCKPQNLSVHLEINLFTIVELSGENPFSVERSRSWIPLCLPLVLAKPFIEKSIDFGNLTLGERYFAVELLRWGWHGWLLTA